MDRERGFSFKLLVPPRLSSGPVSAVRPQEIVDNCVDSLTPMQQQGLTPCFNRDQQRVPNKSIHGLIKPKGQDVVKMKVVSPLDKEESCDSELQYTKLLDEVEKLKFWRAKIASETKQKERQLYENKQTIERQCKAIQDLQFGNESLSLKLEEQISKNDELRNRNDETSHLCNILKYTFERSVDKMQLFECEREETHHLLLEYQDTLQKQIEAFETLLFKAETNQGELLKAKEELMRFEDLKIKFQQECNLKDKQLEDVQCNLTEKGNKLNNIMIDFKETKAQYSMLQEELDKKSNCLTTSKAECESLCIKLLEAEQRWKETENALAMLVAKNEEAAEILQDKDFNFQKLSQEKIGLIECLQQMQLTVDELRASLTAETQKAHELENRMMSCLAELEKAKNELGEMGHVSFTKEEEIKSLKEEMDEKNKSIEVLNSRIDVISTREQELTSELLNKTEEVQKLKEECGHAGKDLDELKAQSILSQVRVDELETLWTNEKKKCEEKSLEASQLKREITQLNCTYESLVSHFNELQSVKSALEQKLEDRIIYANTVEENIKMREKTALELTDKMEKFANENQQLRTELETIKSQLDNNCQEMDTLKKNLEENERNLQDEITKQERRIKVIESKNKTLKKQASKEAVKFTELQDTINNLVEENKNLKREHEERQSLLQNQQNAASELEIQVQKLTLEAEEAVRCQKDSELKCQTKIADMITLMEKHKSQYDRMVHEKDAELDANKEREQEAVAHEQSLKEELSKQKKENDSLKKVLKEHEKEKENLQKELSGLKNEKKTPMTPLGNKQSLLGVDQMEQALKTPVESIMKLYRFDFSKATRTPSSIKDEFAAVVGNTCSQESERPRVQTPNCPTPRSMSLQSETVKTPKMTASRSASKIKSYRIRTPPSAAKKWEDSVKFEPKSDSSGSDYFMLAKVSPTKVLASRCDDSMSHQSKSPLNSKSSKNYTKYAAMKRVRDAGWTAATSKGKKKKTNEKIFA